MTTFAPAAPSLAVERPFLESFYRQMAIIRRVEESLLRLFSEGRLHGTVHTCLGQEACAVGTVGALDKSRDIIFSNHRCHGHFLAYCGDVEGLIGELMGCATGVCRGVGGSQHLHKANFFSNGILGGTAPVAAGMALAEKMKCTGAVAVVFLGDGALGEGAVYESLNIASLWKLPILFAVEHNHYAQSTPTALQLAGTIEGRAAAFDIAVETVDGNDVADVHQTAKRLIEGIRRDSRPAVLLMDTYRLGPHSKGDDHRDPEEIERHRRVEPLHRLRKQLDSAWCHQVDREVAQLVDRAIEAAARASVVSSGELVQR